MLLQIGYLLLATTFVASENILIWNNTAPLSDENGALSTKNINYIAKLLTRIPADSTCSVSRSADLFFVLDGSRSVSITTFHLVAKNIITNVIGKLDVERSNIRIAVIVFSNDIRYVIPLRKYDRKVDLLRAIMGLNYPGGWTDLNKMKNSLHHYLKLAKAESTNKDRDTIVVYLTDGQDTNGEFEAEEMALLQSDVTDSFVISLRSPMNSKVFEQLVPNPNRIFSFKQPTTFVKSLIQSLHGDSRCVDSCYHLSKDEVVLRKLAGLLEAQRDELFHAVLVQFKEEKSLVQYIEQAMHKVRHLTLEIKDTCGDESSLSQKLEELNVQYYNVTTSVSNGNAALNLEAIISQFMTSINELTKKIYSLKAEIGAKQSILESRRAEITSLKEQYESILHSKTIIIETYQKNLMEMRTKIAHTTVEIEKVSSQLSVLESLNSNITGKVELQVSRYELLDREYRQLTKRYQMLSKLNTGEEVTVFTELRTKLATCRNFIGNDFVNILFDTKAGCGKDVIFELENSDLDSYSMGSYNSTLSYYKSMDLSSLFVTGTFKSVSLRLLNNWQVISEVTFDTRRQTLRTMFDAMHVLGSSGFARYTIQSYKFLVEHSLSENLEFHMLIGDYSRYQMTKDCADLVGYFVILRKSHRCFPMVSSFPAFFTSKNPLGGRLDWQINQIQIVAGDIVDWDVALTPVVSTRVLKLALTSGAGDISHLMLTDSFTPEFTAVDIESSRISTHFKSSSLTRLDYSGTNIMRFDVRDNFNKMVAFVEFTGPFTSHHYFHAHGLSHMAYNHNWHGWFSSNFVTKSLLFDLKLVKRSQFWFHIRNEFFAIGQHLEQSCDKRRYFLLVLNGHDACNCFPENSTPQVYYANSVEPVPCKMLQPAYQVRLSVETD